MNVFKPTLPTNKETIPVIDINIHTHVGIEQILHNMTHMNPVDQDVE